MCCCHNNSSRPLQPYAIMINRRAVRIERDSHYFYDVSFTSRPLRITVTSSANHLNGYITSFTEKCGDKDDIVPNSKIISVNGVLVEGLTVILRFALPKQLC